MDCTKITKLLTIDAPKKDVVFDGVDFTEDGFVKVANANSVTFRNCRVYKLNTSGAAKNYWLLVNTTDPIRIAVELCFFGGNPRSAGAVYNLLEPHAILSDGSLVSQNYFVGDCCTHNAVNIYGAEDGSRLEVDRNVFELSAGTVRIGVKGKPECLIDVSGNRVLANNPAYTDEDAGIVTVQPYGKSTSTFANMTVTMDGNECPSEQLIYGYYGSADTVLTDDKMPRILVDGAEIKAPIYH